MRASIPPDLMSCSILTSSALVFLNWKFKPQKVSLGVRSSTATLRAVPPMARRVPTTRTWVVWPERRLVSSSSLPILGRSEEHTSELQSHHDLVCRLLLEKKKEEKKQTIDS